MKNNKIIIKNGDVKSMENKKLSKVASQRVEKNLKVLKLLKENDINISLEEKRSILDEYTGWGGLRDAIYTPSIYKQLKSYLSDDRINDLKKTTKSAYYTPELLVKFIWSTLSIIGFKGGKILEPAVGHGVFVQNIPQSISNNSIIDAVEMDLVTCRILIQKHPKIKLTATCFENIYFNQEKYDLIASNPP